MPGITDTQIIAFALEQSVQKKPNAKNGQTVQAVMQMYGLQSWRGPLLAPAGTREREWELYQYSIHDYNTLFKSGVAVTTKRVVSTPWELAGPSKKVQVYQDILWNADFGAGWESFISKVIKDFTRYDSGAYIELIGGGDPNGALLGAPVGGLSALDGLRCYPTGDPNYPVIYMDEQGELHLMHESRVKRMVDMPDTYTGTYAYGECALTRCIGPVWRDILMNRYVEQTLDDNPPPGIMLFKNLDERVLQDAFLKLDKERNTDFGSKWGNVLRLYGLHADTMPEVTSIPYSATPDKFDYVAYKELNVKEIALGLGVDIQDLWELTGNNLGTATQSEVLHQKSKGQLLGTLYKSLERLINQALPKDLEFSFQYQDAEEDQQEADKAAIWVNTVLALGDDLSPEERRRLLANQIPAIRDVITDEQGRVIRVDDDDPKAPDQLQPMDIGDAPQPANEAVADDTGEMVEKDLAATQDTFRRDFSKLVSQVQQGALSKAVVKPALRLALIEGGASAYKDGLDEGGVKLAELDDEGRKTISIWRSQQAPFLNRFVDEIFNKDLPSDEIGRRADMWINKSINPMYFAGLAAADSQQRYMWVVDPVKEHCATCLKLNGQVHRMKEYTKINLLPQSPSLVCGGWNCGCKLTKTDQPSRGSLRSVRYVRGRKEYDPNQPRDAEGKFGSGGGGGAAAPKRDYQQFNEDDYKKWDNDLWGIETESNAGYKQIEAAKAYTGDEYQDINGHLRGTLDGEPSEQVKRHTEDLKALTDRRLLNKDLVTYRADSGKGLPNGGDLSDSEFEALAGSSMHDKGFTSTSVESSHLSEYGNIQYEIRVPAGSRGAYLEPVSKYAEEREFLIGEGTNYKIAEAHSGNPRRLVLEVQPD